MLARSPASRRRLVSGATTVAALVVAGLGLTASGSGAAAITAGVRQEVMQAPAAPPAPPAPAITPETPVTPITPTTPRAPRHAHRVVIVRDGKTRVYENGDADRYVAEHGLRMPPVPPVAPLAPTAFVVTDHWNGRDGAFRVNIPDIRSGTCAGGDARETVQRDRKHGRDRMIICTNRIEAMARDADRVALNADVLQRSARIQARASLGTARMSVERDRNLSDEQRREALDGIAQAERELSTDVD